MTVQNSVKHTNPDVVDQHLVETNGAEGAFDDVGDGWRCHDWAEKKDIITPKPFDKLLVFYPFIVQ